ncbi:MAG TPA: CvpA family protein [Candidatus Binatus sp.]|nr:CvpA family protein [Candidatus Binatus sp.]
MNPLDALLVILLVPFAFRGYFRGFCRETLGLVGIFGGVLAAAAAGPGFAQALVDQKALPAVAAWPVACAAIFVTVLVVAAIAGRIADGIARALLLGGVNRVAGALFGCAKGAAVLGFALLLSERLIASPSLTKVIAASRLGRPLEQIAGSVVQKGRQLGAGTGERQV